MDHEKAKVITLRILEHIGKDALGAQVVLNNICRRRIRRVVAATRLTFGKLHLSGHVEPVILPARTERE